MRWRWGADLATIDTNVLLRFLLNDEPRQSAAAARLVRAARDTGQALHVPVSVALELEWVLRSRFKMVKADVIQTFIGLLETVELQFACETALEWALNLYESSVADFGDCVHAALASQAEEPPLWTFDKNASKLDGARLLPL